MSRNLLLFLGIFLLAAVFRLTNLNYIEFKTDEAVNLLLALRPIYEHVLSPGGTVSSLGVLNPPFFNYILLPIIAINPDPRFVAFIIGLINSLSIAFLFLLIKKYYGQINALASSALLALSPWAILYSRKIWMQDLLIPFLVIFLFCIHKLILEKKTVYWLPYAISSLFLIQLHQASVIFVGLATFFLVRKVKLNFKLILFGILIGILPLIPYFSYEMRNNCPDCKSFIDARNRLSSRFPSLFMRPLQIASEGDFRFILGNDTLNLENLNNLALLRKIFYLEYILIPLGAIIFFKKNKKLRFLLYSALSLPFLYFLLKFEPFMHYYIIIIPLIFLFLGAVFELLISSKNLLLKFPSLILLISIIVISTIYNQSFFSLLKSKGALEGDYGVAFYKTDKNIKDGIREFKNQKDYEEIYLSSYISLDYLYGYMPLGRILYGDVDYTKSQQLELKLEENSKDPRVTQALFAYNTKKTPTLETLDLLRSKKSHIPQYEPLYKQVLQDYLYQHYKKEYMSSALGIRFLYPEHWKAKEENNQIILEGDGKIFHLTSDSRLTNDTVINEIIKSIRPI